MLISKSDRWLFVIILGIFALNIALVIGDQFDGNREHKYFGDKCVSTDECSFPGSICDPQKRRCQCIEELQVTNHLDKCGKPAIVNETCFFNEQCEAESFQTECRNGKCICRFEMTPVLNSDGQIKCKNIFESHQTNGIWNTYTVYLGILATVIIISGAHR